MGDFQACYSSQGAGAIVANFIMTGCIDQDTCIQSVHVVHAYYEMFCFYIQTCLKFHFITYYCMLTSLRHHA